MRNDRTSLLESVYALNEQQHTNAIPPSLRDPHDFRLKGRLRTAMAREFELGLASLAQLQTEGAVGAFVNRRKAGKL
jgi:hypothetical protein